MNDINGKYQWNGKTILVVEDEDTNYMFMKAAIKKTNAKILRANSGLEAVELCKTNQKINVVVMDIKMPEMNGYQASIKIREFRKDLPIIAHTAYSFEGDKENCLAAGCDDYIAKPIRYQTLLSTINRWIN